MKNILVTGGAGYIGSVLSTQLCDNKFNVTCVDKLLFNNQAIDHLINRKNFEFHNCDINNYDDLRKILNNKKYYAVIHLAAIVGDPACKMYEEEAKKTNLEASKWLINECINNNIERFIFASTCSNYGKMRDNFSYVNEESPLKPLSLYAQLKVEIEKYILNEIDKKNNFSPTVLRFSTVYGHSYRMRFDLTVNEFSKELANKKELLVFGEQFWRPYCHVDDFANAYISILNTTKDKVAYNVFNVGDTSENYTKKMLIKIISEILPDSKLNFVKKNEDPRDYRVNFDKIKNELGFKISKKVPDGVKEILSLIAKGHYKNTEDQKYYNIPHNA